MAARNLFLMHKTVSLRFRGLQNPVRKILHRVHCSSRGMVLNFSSDQPSEFHSKAVRTTVEPGLIWSLPAGLKFLRAGRSAMVFVLLLVPLADCAPDRSFHLMEASFADIHKAMLAGTLTCHSLVQEYLDRIHAYDQQGPAINSMLYINPAILRQATAFDQEFRRTHKLRPLGCIPIVLKD